MAKKTRTREATTKVELSGDAVVAFEALQKITKRTAEETAADAMNTYLWIIFQQVTGNKIASIDTKNAKRQILAMLAKNVSAAKRYFKVMGWI